MTATDLCFTPAAALVRLFRRKKVSPLEVTRAVLDRIEDGPRSEEHTSELQSRFDLVCRLLLEKKKSI